MTDESENLYRQEKIQKYTAIFSPLFRYIPWLTEKAGQSTSRVYDDDGMLQKSVPVMVYDSTLLSLVKELQATGLMDRNYVYTLSRNGLRTSYQEKTWIKEAELQNIEDIVAIMAKYVLGGMTKGRLWSDAVWNGIFLDGLVRIKEILEIHDKPLA